MSASALIADVRSLLGGEPVFLAGSLVAERFLSKVALSPSGCWLWTKALSRGYGHFWFEGRYVQAHVWIYEQLVGPVPDGKELDHTCRVRHCVNVLHLEPVTSRVNKLRGEGPRLLSLQRRPDPTKCGKGLHDWTEENIYHLKHGDRCKPCTRAYKNGRRADERISDHRRRTSAASG